MLPAQALWPAAEPLLRLQGAEDSRGVGALVLNGISPDTIGTLDLEQRSAADRIHSVPGHHLIGCVDAGRYIIIEFQLTAKSQQ